MFYEFQLGQLTYWELLRFTISGVRDTVRPGGSRQLCSSLCDPPHRGCGPLSVQWSVSASGAGAGSGETSQAGAGGGRVHQHPGSGLQTKAESEERGWRQSDQCFWTRLWCSSCCSCRTRWTRPCWLWSIHWRIRSLRMVHWPPCPPGTWRSWILSNLNQS